MDMRKPVYALLCVLMIALLGMPLTASAQGYNPEQDLREMVETANEALQNDDDDPYARVWLDDSRGELMMSSGFDPSEIPDLNDEDTYFRYKEFLMSVWLKSDFFSEMFRLTGLTGRDLRFVLVDMSADAVAATVLFSTDELAIALMQNSPGHQEAQAQLDEINEDLLIEMVDKANAKVRAEDSYNSVRIDDSNNAVIMSLLVGPVGLDPLSPEDEENMDIKEVFLSQMMNSDISSDWSVFINITAATGRGLWFRLYEFPGESTPWTLRYSDDDLFILGERLSEW